MPATPADISRFTTDGIVITSPTDPAVTAAILAEHVDALDGAGEEIEMFFDDPADAQIMLDEKFTYLRQAVIVHEGIEVDETVDLAEDAATIPSVRVIDAMRGIDQVVRVRAYAQDMGADRFSVEVLQ